MGTGHKIKINEKEESRLAMPTFRNLQLEYKYTGIRAPLRLSGQMACAENRDDARQRLAAEGQSERES